MTSRRWSSEPKGIIWTANPDHSGDEHRRRSDARASDDEQ
jgi:hypothetical protein